MTGELDPRRFGLAGGILWAGALFLWTLIVAAGVDFGEQALEIGPGGIYPGYAVSYGGAFVGAFWGFIDGFVALFAFAWLYNWLGKKTEKPESDEE